MISLGLLIFPEEQDCRRPIVQSPSSSSSPALLIRMTPSDLSGSQTLTGDSRKNSLPLMFGAVAGHSSFRDAYSNQYHQSLYSLSSLDPRVNLNITSLNRRKSAKIDGDKVVILCLSPKAQTTENFQVLLSVTVVVCVAITWALHTQFAQIALHINKVGSEEANR